MSNPKTAKRRHWFTRDPAPPRLVLTERDVSIVVACYQFQGLTRPQVQRLIGMPGITRANERLRLLWEHGYLERLAIGTPGAGHQPLYVPGQEAIDMIATHTGQLPATVRSHFREDSRRSPLTHDTQMNDCRI